MKKLMRICFLSGLTAVFLLSVCGLSACRGDGGKKTPDTDTDPEKDTHPGDDPTETPTEPVTELETYPAWVDEPNAKTVNVAADLANGVTAYYEGNGRSAFAVKNQNVYLCYDMTDRGQACITTLETPDGKPYMTGTGDSFVTLKDGTTLRASGTSARANVYDQGFYYYDVHILDQNFMGPDACDHAVTLDPAEATGLNMMKKAKAAGEWCEFSVSDPTDPFVFFNGLSIDTADVDAILITLRCDVSTEGYLYYVAGSQKTYNNDQKIRFTIQNDGQFHTVAIPMQLMPDFTGKLTGIRFDIGTAKNEQFAIRSVQAVSYKQSIPHISLDRNFIAYSDKLNDVTRFIATKDASGVQTLGTEYRILRDTVDKLVKTDALGRQNEQADADSLVSVGFDVRDAGVVGFILLDDGSGARLTFTEDGGDYVVRQEWTVPSGTLKNGQEITIGRRIYTDESHDFGTFLYEAYCERHPLTDVAVANEQPGRTCYAGYNALRGVYEFMVDSGRDFSALYNDPDHQYPVTFAIRGDGKDRRIYVMSHTTKGWLECAALLDADQRMLPVRLEVNKNFAGDGEEPFYTHNDSVAYGYTVFPMVAEADNTEQLTVVHLYERWGQFRLKQISSIRFHQAYYHQSLGVTETNCIAFYNNGNRLPDHRGLSQPYWEDIYFSALDANGNPVGQKTPMNGGPEHENTGTHTFLQYTDADGVRVLTESRSHDISTSGPVYYDITMHYITTDGRMTADIRHAEMPQYDENRAYTQLDYEVKQSFSVKNFRSDFEIYGISSSKLPCQYTKVGYLGADNQGVIKDVNAKTKAVQYTLGSECPYFDLFKLQDPDPRMFDSNDLYSNVSVLIRDWDIVIGGEKYEGALLVSDKDGRLTLTLDLGEVTLLPGDHIRMNMILMPWGGYDSKDDENVRLTRENTLLHPIVLTSETDTVLTNDPWIPKVRTEDGKTAVFTISGGLDNLGDRKGTASEGQTKFTIYYDRDFNVAVRVYGFRDFGKAAVYEQIDGEWVPVELASVNGYDGYAILYDEDNTFSVSFPVCMNEAKPRTFKVITE
ncbi:MAG: hypothetical protein MJ192_10945 [Clostridia bacterium]|nr:hypothetical protein [Clostridia bacterium]